MSVVISPNIKKESVRINLNGDQIDPRTKQVIKPVEKPYVPPPQEVKSSEEKSGALSDKIEKLIEDKINKLVEDKINKVLEKLL